MTTNTTKQTANANVAHTYDAETPLNEPVEIRMTDAFGNRKTLTAWLTDRGTVGYSYGGTGDGGGAESLSNVGSALPFPGKAVKGWQAEVVAFATSSLKTVTEVR